LPYCKPNVFSKPSIFLDLFGLSRVHTWSHSGVEAQVSEYQSVKVQGTNPAVGVRRLFACLAQVHGGDGMCFVRPVVLGGGG
jgi:hypothetical protein